MTYPLPRDTPKFRRLSVLLIWAALVGLLGGHPTSALTRAEARAAYDAAEALRDADAVAAYNAMALVSEAGDGRATSRLAFYTLRGIGTSPDIAAAEVLYGLAMEQGHTRSILSRAKVLMLQGKGEEAASFFEAAVDREIKGARAEAATAHALARLGEVSRPQQGWSALQALAVAGDPTAELSLLRVASRVGRPALADEAVLLKRVQARARQGDGRAAEALLPYLRGPGRDSTGSLALRLEMLDHPDIRPQIAVAERLYLAADLQPERFWRAAEEIFAQTPEPARARALVVTAKINRNAYLWVVEPYLEDAGYTLRGRRGYLNGSQIRALNALCRTVSPSPECAKGPLKSSSVKAVAEALF